MQTYKIFSIRDTKLSIYNNPFHATSEIEAQRIFTMACRDTNTRINNFPTDFELVLLGEFNDVTGKYDQLDNHKFITNAQITISADMQEMIKESHKQQAELQNVQPNN